MASKEKTSSIDAAQNLLRARLTQHAQHPSLHDLKSERTQLLDVVRRTASLGESNSILVVGPSGSGKSALVSSVLSELRQDNDVSGNFLEVHLNGLMQTNDRIALNEITVQLQLENTLGDKVFTSCAETLKFLLDSLKNDTKKSKSVLFFLEEFDLFAHHKNQILLYNLFDISQSAQAPICVVGLTTRLDVMELLEKRVKSRFSHRQVHIQPCLTWERYLNLASDYLTLPDDFSDRSYAEAWNEQVMCVLKESAVQDILRHQHNISTDVKSLQMLLFLPVCKVDPDEPFLRSQYFVESCQIRKHNSKSAMLQGLSVLELCLLIAMKHLMEIYDGEPFNFEMIYREYVQFCEKKAPMHLFQKQVVMKAFEHLCALELVVSADGTCQKGQKEYRLLTMLVRDNEIDDVLKGFQGCPTEIKQWAASSLAANY